MERESPEDPVCETSVPWAHVLKLKRVCPVRLSAPRTCTTDPAEALKKARLSLLVLGVGSAPSAGSGSSDTSSNRTAVPAREKSRKF